MLDPHATWIAAGFLVAAILYSSVGHAGASGYLAVMALSGMAPAEMKPIALVLNVIVSVIGTTLYARAGFVSLRALWPFLLGSVPLAFIGGGLPIPPHAFKTLLGALLAVAAGRLLTTSATAAPAAKAPPVPVAVGVGAGIGLLSGLTGTGGGIFLTPILLFAGWADARGAAGMSSAFILANSLAGLAGSSAGLPVLPAAFPLWAAAVVLGGSAGAWLGSRKLVPVALRRLLAVVLLVAAGKLAFT